MDDDATLIVDIAEGKERRLAYGLGPSGGQAMLSLEDGDSIPLKDGDLRFLKRAMAAIELPPPYSSLSPPFELDEPAERPSSKSQPDPLPRKAGKPWSEDDHATLARLYCAGTSTGAIAQVLSRTETAIIGRLIANGLATLQPTSQLQETPE